MYQFFVDASDIKENEIFITGSDVNHIKNVLRMRIGEEIRIVSESDDKEYSCEIKEYADECVVCKIRFVKESDVELPNEIYLLQGLAKGEKMELIVQKAVELGVFSIIPVSMARSVVKLDKKKAEAKVKRWNAISESAAKQSKRKIIPQITDVMSVKEAVEFCKTMEIRMLPYELSDMDGMNFTRELIRGIKPGEKVAVFIGPEGGFTDDEVALAKRGGFETITLGHRILRTETAGMTVLSWLVLMLEN